MQEITVDPQSLPGHLLSEQIVICTTISCTTIICTTMYWKPAFLHPSLLLHLRLSDDLKRFVLTFQPPNSTNIFLLWVEDCLDFLLLLNPCPVGHKFPFIVLPSLGSRGRVGGEICTTIGELLSAAQLFNPPVCSAGQTGGITFRSIPNIFQTFGKIIFCKTNTFPQYFWSWTKLLSFLFSRLFN